MQVITGLAVVGAVPLTAGVVGWITGFCMGLAGHGRWHAWAQAGQILMLAGAACGLVLLGLVVAWRGRPPRPGYAAARGPDLVPLASPEQQQDLAGPPPQSYPLYPQEHYAPPGFRPERPWS
jgi:hypothetical protein